MIICRIVSRKKGQQGIIIKQQIFIEKDNLVQRLSSFSLPWFLFTKGVFLYGPKDIETSVRLA